MRKLIALLLMSMSASAATWYASPSGSGTACTIGSPCTTSQAETNASAGDTILFRDGVYGIVTFTKSGTSPAHLIFRAENKWGAQFTAAGSAGGHIFRSNGNYVEIRDIEITGSANAVDGILLGGNSGNGSNVIIDGNKIHDLPNPTCNGGGGIHIWDNLLGTDVTVSNNIIYNIGTSTCDQQHGIYSTGSGHILFNNLIYNIRGYGIHLWHTATDQVVANNTVVDAGLSGTADGIVIGAQTGEGTVDNTAVFNNIVVNAGRYGISEHGDYGADNTYSNNDTYNSVSTNTRNDTGSLGESNAVHADPVFVDAGSDDYHIQTSSPAKDTGVASLAAGTTTGTAPVVDLDGLARPQNTLYDIGAYEYDPGMSPPPGSLSRRKPVISN